ncbi:hypothetical protein L6164_020934 [Bauhinia variegata]|uniref:Uncharacterized protein n=1 Tax=Bauhinia variegata TaxID=167791 RepID=A0ACB9MYN7_BAUVA|nr:hypothetical protein L6164_020934 [Bauhinia variegata]
MGNLVFFQKSRFPFYATILLLFFCTVHGGGNETDQLALLEFKKKISNDPLGIMSSWNLSYHFCQWRGITCGKLHQRVTILNLSSQRLQGSISPYIGNLTFLQRLNLNNNSFNGEIPPQIGNLRRLQVLRLDENLLSGEIPSNISGCSNLLYINLGSNSFVGQIPSEFGALTKLRTITLEYNNLTGGLPPYFGNFSDLEGISTTVNNLGGTIPDSLGQLKKLLYLFMGGNLLSGTIPPSIYNLSSMYVLCVPQNKLHGTIPSDLGNIFPRMTEYNIGDNLFTGTIPASLSNASNLERFTIAINGISGNMPSLEKLQKLWWLSISTNNLGTGRDGDLDFLNTVSNKTSLERIAINSNNFGGSFPISITNFTSLSILTLDKNNLHGNIPAEIGNLVNLEWMYTGGNKFTGHIPEEIGKLIQLKKLDFQGNGLTGNIPASLGNLTQLTHLYMYNNSLSGVIPPTLGKCQSLLLLNLNQNNLSGPIPREIMSIPSLSIYLGMSQNNLNGSLPLEVGTLINLGVLDVSHNMLSGEIPPTLGSSIRLEFLYMQHNFFQGNIPESLSSLKGIQVIDCSYNYLSGNIPEFLADFDSLRRLNLSFNDFVGMVPEKGIFKNSSAASVVGNKLCGGIAELQLSKCNFRNSRKGRLTLTSKLVIAASATVCVALAMSILYFLYAKKIRVKPTSSSSVNSLLQVSYQSLLEATNKFSSSNLIGVGSFGSVYKGILEKEEKVVAIKVLNLVNPRASKSFQAECEALRNIRHRNLVKLITACSSVDYQGNDFKALVYEFLAYGSLEEWLHPIINIQAQIQRSLNLFQRLNIPIDVASALEYLHHYCEPPVVHCDLKPNNVLLDDQMVGHIGDFGLARFFLKTTQNNAAPLSSTIGIRGTIGYTAPEYGMGNEVSKLGDVHSYGVLLLEMFTGKRPTDEMFKDGMNLHTYAKASLPKLVEEILDPFLLQEVKGDVSSRKDPQNQGNYVIEECLISIFEVGIACSDEFPSERMSIKDATAQLIGVKEKLLN